MMAQQTAAPWSPRRDSHPARGPAAFTLVEIMIGLALVATVVGALYSSMTYGMARTVYARDNLRATQILLEKFETLRLNTWDKMIYGLDLDDLEDDPDAPFDSDDPHNAGDEPEPFIVPTTFTVPYTPGETNGLIYYGTYAVTNAPIGDAAYSNDLLQITVSVTWTNGTQVRSRSMRTYFSRYGMQYNIRK